MNKLINKLPKNNWYLILSPELVFDSFHLTRTLLNDSSKNRREGKTKFTH